MTLSAAFRAAESVFFYAMIPPHCSPPATLRQSSSGALNSRRREMNIYAKLSGG